MRHRPQRDADNTWRTWINAMCSGGGTDQEHWAAGAPLAGWRPAAIASVLDTCIDTLVLYELRHSVGPLHRTSVIPELTLFTARERRTLSLTTPNTQSGEDRQTALPTARGAPNGGSGV
jgi:hypothetical protein